MVKSIQIKIFYSLQTKNNQTQFTPEDYRSIFLRRGGSRRFLYEAEKNIVRFAGGGYADLPDAVAAGGCGRGNISKCDIQFLHLYCRCIVEQDVGSSQIFSFPGKR